MRRRATRKIPCRNQGDGGDTRKESALFEQRLRVQKQPQNESDAKGKEEGK